MHNDLEMLLEKVKALPPEARRAVAGVIGGDTASQADARQTIVSSRWKNLQDKIAGYGAAVEYVEDARRTMVSGLAILSKLQDGIELTARDLNVAVPRLGAHVEAISSLLKTADTRSLATLVENWMRELKSQGETS